jgi:TIR domain-containing protein/uncharacterized protein DUF4062
MKVYISSATEEMRYYREAARRAIRDAGMEPVFLNDEVPPTLDPRLTLLEQNERFVKDCDAFVGLYGYGGTWQPDDEESKLISEWEYEWARSEGLPCFCYMPGTNSPEGLRPDAPHPRMELFKHSLERKYHVFRLQDPEKVYESLKSRLGALHDSIFLSYSSKDREFAIWIKGEFKKDNYSLWRDGDSIEPGSAWMDQLTKALETCRIMVLVLSPDSINAKYVALEVEEFQTRGKRIFPVKARPCDIPEHLSKLQVVDATKNRERAYLRLKRGVEDALKAQ